MKYIVIVVAFLLICGCVAADQKFVIKERVEVKGWDLKVLANCEDGIILYYYGVGYGAGMWGTRDKDLVEKYCGCNL